ncbi:MAG: hypothetical protein AB7S26_28340 [Sandaracinaceae bacterium]
MGFFDNLKNAVTGGAAEVRLETGPAVRGQVLQFRVHAQAKSDAQVNAVYLLIRAVETCQVKDTDWDDGKRMTETVRGRKVSFEQKVNVAPGGQLANGQAYSWDGQVQLPAQVGPTFRGTMIAHTWEVQAGLDMTGNDPDSGWITLEVQ